jgi:hypothetical protein
MKSASCPTQSRLLENGSRLHAGAGGVEVGVLAVSYVLLTQRHLQYVFAVADNASIAGETR